MPRLAFGHEEIQTQVSRRSSVLPAQATLPFSSFSFPSRRLMAYGLWCAVRRYSSATRLYGASGTGRLILTVAYGLWCAVRRCSSATRLC
eukprot:1842608-Prymnesium_polylepis.1